jgi:hypothetical protein
MKKNEINISLKIQKSPGKSIILIEHSGQIDKKIDL